METANIVVYAEDSDQAVAATQLADSLSLPYIAEITSEPIVLALTKTHLELRFPQEKMKPIVVDFLKERVLRRLQKSRGELIVRAVGIKGQYYPTVIDATAGLGVDALILAYLGCHVSMVERSPVICALLKDGLTRAQAHPSEWVSRLTLTCEDAKIFLQRKIISKEFVDVVYLDPMFPTRQKSALVRKEMRILAQIVGTDTDAQMLLSLARTCAKKRVVIKRHKNAMPLGDVKPDVVLTGKVCRFDIYLMNQE